MTKLFYDHLIIIEEISADLHEDKEILELVDQIMHQEILATILRHLPKEKHEMFLIHFHATPDDKKVLDFLQEHTSVDIEKEILKTANLVKKKVFKEIESAKH